MSTSTSEKVLSADQLAGLACIVCGSSARSMIPLGIETTSSTDVFRCTACACDRDQAVQWVADSDPMLKNLRKLMESEDDVKRVVRLERRGDVYRYLIETPFKTFPKFVIGTTDAGYTWAQPGSKCGLLETAEAAWHRDQ